MRRAQSVRHQGRPSLAVGADDLGVLREGDESVEDSLRRQLLEKDRENDKLKMQIQSLQAQLAQRPPLDHVQELEREYKNLELLLQGTNRENEKAMMDLERGKAREKMLERELAKLAGENWQASLDISDSPAPTSSLARPLRPAADAPDARAHAEQVRLLVLGMEQRLQAREDALTRSVERAEREAARFDEVAHGVIT